jgi:hypothetical protein
MNPLRRAPSAYIDALTLPELHAELVLAASRLVGTRVVSSGLNAEFFVCRECAGRGRDRHQVLHLEDCNAGMVAHLLLAVAHAEAARVAPKSLPTQPTRKEPSTTKDDSRCEPAETAAEEKRPYLLPKVGAFGEPWAVNGDGDVVDAAGNVMVDSFGCSLVDPDEQRMMHRIALCVNFFTGTPTASLETAMEQHAAAGGGR